MTTNDWYLEKLGIISAEAIDNGDWDTYNAMNNLMNQYEEYLENKQDNSGFIPNPFPSGKIRRRHDRSADRYPY